MRTFRYVPVVTEWDVIIDEDNLIKAWKLEFNFMFDPNCYNDWINEIKAYDEWEERETLWEILTEALCNREFPVFKLYPVNCNHNLWYKETFDQIETDFDRDFADFCINCAEEVANDLGLYFKE